MGSEQIRLHSLHNPVREAERFVSLVLARKNPRYIVITEPGESYTASVFREKYPDATCIALRYTPHLFSDTDSLWDLVWRPDSGSGALDFLFQAIPEEYLSSTVFLSWKPSETRWSRKASEIWHEISELVKIQSAVIRTRAHFGKRWLDNTIRNTVYSTNPVLAPVVNLPVFLACAGPSLEKALPLPHEQFFIVSLSSALTCLRHHGIRPDMCVTTDGGYWAREHFHDCPGETVVAFPPEAVIPRNVLENNPLLLLTYGTSLEQELFERTGIQPLEAERNGTVAGTAATLMLHLSYKPLVAAGLDLQETKGLTHARPHSFDAHIQTVTERTNTLATVLHDRSGSAMALNAYARWFAGHAGTFGGRFFRIPESLRLIPEIPQASVDSFFGCKGQPKPEYRLQNVPDSGKRSRIAADFLKWCAQNLRSTTCLEEADLLSGELVQLVNFTGYSEAVSGGDPTPLILETAGFLETMAARLRLGE